MNRYHKTSGELEKEYQEVRAAQSDHRLFRVLYERYYEPVFLFIWRRTGDEDLSADLCQQAFLKAMLHLKKFVFRGVPFSAWVFRIALNEMNMHYRRTKKERCISLEEEEIGELASETGSGDDEQKIKELLKNVSVLPEPDIQLLELRFFEKRSFAEIGLILGITENNAKVKTYRILDKLKSKMRSS